MNQESFPGVTVIGIDPSLRNTAVCVIRHSGRPEAEELFQTSAEQHRAQNLVDLRARVMMLIKREMILDAKLYVAMEAEFVMGASNQGTEPAAVQAIYQTLFWGMNVADRFISINPVHVKKYVGAKQKNEILLQTYKHYRREYKDDNRADAFLIAKIAHDFVMYKVWKESPEKLRLTKPQIEVLDKLRFLWASPPVKKEKKAKKVKA